MKKGRITPNPLDKLTAGEIERRRNEAYNHFCKGRRFKRGQIEAKESFNGNNVRVYPAITDRC